MGSGPRVRRPGRGRRVAPGQDVTVILHALRARERPVTNRPDHCTPTGHTHTMKTRPGYLGQVDHGYQVCTRWKSCLEGRRVVKRGDAMKVPERTGMWIEMARSEESNDEITLQVPSGIWAGWMKPIHLRDDDVAAFLRSIGWHVDLPKSAHRV